MGSFVFVFELNKRIITFTYSKVNVSRKFKGEANRFSLENRIVKILSFQLKKGN